MSLQQSLLYFWQQGDVITQGVAALLLIMSIGSWTIIICKSVHLAKLQGFGSFDGNNETINQFWEAQNLNEGMGILNKLPPFLYLVEQAQQARKHYDEFHLNQDEHALDAGMSINELVTRALRQSLARISVQLDRGQIFLASIGSTAPFVGLLGTVWGIYHALAVIHSTGQSSLDAVAGPVGEALIMTAVGLFVAIPSVLSYNAFTRSQRVIMSDLDGFAHDLQLFFSLNNKRH